MEPFYKFTYELQEPTITIVASSTYFSRLINDTVNAFENMRETAGFKPIKNITFDRENWVMAATTHLFNEFLLLIRPGIKIINFDPANTFFNELSHYMVLNTKTEWLSETRLLLLKHSCHLNNPYLQTIVTPSYAIIVGYNMQRIERGI